MIYRCPDCGDFYGTWSGAKRCKPCREKHRESLRKSWNRRNADKLRAWKTTWQRERRQARKERP